jgi:co-chaperonin GroES (HSP10)
MFAAVLLDPDGDWLDGCAGNQGTVERWVSGFKFSDQDDIYYCNMFLTDKEYWTVKNQQIFARKEGDAWEMLNGYVLLEAQEQVIENSILILPDSVKKKVDHQRARIVNIGKTDLDIKAGEMVYIDYSRCEKYEIEGKHYLITTQKRILGK